MADGSQVAYPQSALEDTSPDLARPRPGTGPEPAGRMRLKALVIAST
ncbi:MAG: hypothetical protein AAFR01_01425 [Pseudomonadota bacterium]